MSCDFRNLIAVVVAACLMLGGCFGQQAAEPQEVDFFEPHDYGTHTKADAGSTDARAEGQDASPDAAEFIPQAGVKPAADFPWLPQDRPIYFHTREESEATREQWEPYWNSRRQPDSGLERSNLNHQLQYFRDANLTELAEIVTVSESEIEQHPDWSDFRGKAVSPTARHVRGRFVGLGAPFTDDYLHMFEMGGVYFMGDYVVSAHVGGINIYFIKSPDTPADPDEVEAKKEPAIAPRFWSWFKEISHRHDDDDQSGLPQSIFLLFMQANAHATTVRNVRWTPYYMEGMGHGLGPSNAWYFDSSLLLTIQRGN